MLRETKEMYEDTGCYDPSVMAEGTGGDNLSHATSNCNQLPPASNSHNSYGEGLKICIEDISYHSPQDNASMSGIQTQQQLPPNPDQIPTDQHLVQQVIQELSTQVFSYGQTNWDSSVQDLVDPHPLDQLQNGHPGYNVIPASLPELPDPPTPDLISLLRLPRSSLLPNSSISFANPSIKATVGYTGELLGPDVSAASSMNYDPLLHLNLPPQPPLIRELCQSLPPGYSLPGSRGASCLIGGVDDQREGSGGMFSDGNGAQFDNGILEFTRDIGCIRKGRGGKVTKHYTTERDRRSHLNGKYDALKSLVPKLTKTDRASVVGDAINYIKELLRTVDELKLLVEKKRRGRDRSKRQKMEGEDDAEAKPLSDVDHSFSNSLRSSWIQRKSKVTEVDVRIIDDEVTIKLVQKKKINCLLFVSKVLDQLKLDLHHVAGGQIGEHYSFLFNSKIYEGSSVYASAIANTLIDVVDEQYMLALPANSY